MTKSQPTQNSPSDLLRAGETYRLQGIENQVKKPSTAFQFGIEKFTEAIGILEQGISTKTAPKASNTSIEQLAWAYAHRGATYIQLGLSSQDPMWYDSAINDFQEATSSKRKPKYAWALAQMGEAYRWKALAILEEADAIEFFYLGLDAFTKAISNAGAGNYPWAYAHRGAIYRWLAFLEQHNKTHLDNCINDLNTAIDQNKQYAWAYAYLSVAYTMKKDFESAYKAIMKVVAINPSMLDSFRNIGFSPLGRQDLLPFNTLAYLPSKVEKARKILQEKPDDPIALYIIALDKAEKEGLEAATKEIEKVRDLGIA